MFSSTSTWHVGIHPGTVSSASQIDAIIAGVDLDITGIDGDDCAFQTFIRFSYFNLTAINRQRTV